MTRRSSRDPGTRVKGQRRARAASRVRRTVAIGAGAGGVGAVALGTGVARRAARALPTDPTGGEPLLLPPGEEARISTRDGGEIVLHDAGSGPQTFVLSHGWTNDRRVWGPVARRLVARGHRVVVYDQRGHAGSTAGTDGLTMSALADDLAAVLDHVGATDVTVAGHSMGGMTAQALLVERPEVVKAHVGAVVLVSTACADVGGPDVFKEVTERVLTSRTFDRALANPRLGLRVIRGVVGRHAHASHLGAVRDLLVATPAPTRTLFAAAMATMDFSEALASIDLPVAIVVGSHDRLTPARQSRRLGGIIRGSTLDVIAGAGHMLSLEAPDELTDLLERTARRARA